MSNKQLHLETNQSNSFYLSNQQKRILVSCGRYVDQSIIIDNPIKVTCKSCLKKIKNGKV